LNQEIAVRRRLDGASQFFYGYKEMGVVVLRVIE
jgi:hypothetical protein